jgi:hypothetical protein
MSFQNVLMNASTVLIGAFQGRCNLVNGGCHTLLFAGSRAMAVPPNPSIEWLSSGGLRTPPAAAHIKR